MDNKYKWLLAALAGTAGLFAGTRMLAHQAVKQIGKILTTDPYHENITKCSPPCTESEFRMSGRQTLERKQAK